MGHRALVAYERPTGGYTVRYSQWGAHGYRLLDAVTESTPLGGRGRGGDAPRVRPGPLGVADDLADLAATYVDPLAHEAAFVVTPSFCVRAFESLAFWLDDPTVEYGGALVPLRRDRDPEHDASELRAWRRGATAAHARAVGDAPRRVHEDLLDALDAEVADRTVVAIPPDSTDATGL
ncbi:hypothetical protein G9C85_16025 [Halorubellus sp. JP-L1]|uniref:DUF6735 family protein n=1 Tax=Halorubellus sp. JP-L1 TaxID=2715753 RepID=UPI0014085610|nr:hypothetical protein [Halorubellus sp. JP-L1]